jgi:hypothetical protein
MTPYLVTPSERAPVILSKALHHMVYRAERRI